jgi:hypothetical protein
MMLIKAREGYDGYVCTSTELAHFFSEHEAISNEKAIKSSEL